MTTRRVALIFDDQVRPDTTGVYCRRALEQLVEVEHFRPDALERAPRRGFDLYVNVDDGLNYALPPDLRPCAWWAIDTHLNYGWCRERARAFDVVFAAQRDGAAQLRADGIATARWLPLACDPEIHAAEPAAKEFDITFVGNVFPGPRRELLELLGARFPNTFVGRRFFREMAQTLARARLVFNRSIRNDVNMRVFEALAAGSLLLTNDLAANGQAELFTDGTHLATYDGPESLLAKANYYLEHAEERERIAADGRAEVLARHTYRHRMERLLAEVDDVLRGRSGPVAVPNQAAPADLTSIVILTHNQLDLTRECLASIRRHTSEPYELVLVDNGSTDGTPDYLRAQADVRLVANAANRGFPAAANQGIRAAVGRQVLLLNNDTVVTAGWLGRLLQPLADRAVGLVGPCSNFVSGEQQVPAPYDSLDNLAAFAADWGADHAGELHETDRLVGFCLLIRREVIDRVGLLDERFGLGCFEDDDYTRRARAAGFRAVIARAAFVHHYGGRTFRSLGVDFGALLEHNERLFTEKWQDAATGASVPTVAPADDTATPPPNASATRVDGPDYHLRALPTGDLLLERRHCRLSLCMIVRDSARTLGACLTSIRPWVDELVVVDTGSTDDTPNLARRLGADVHHFPWCDSFAVARNESLRHARGAWVFWMDADDVIDAEHGRGLRQLAYQEADPETLGYVVQVHCPGAGEAGATDVTVVDHVKLFRNRPNLRFEGRIHEQILPAIRRANGEVGWTDLHVVHAGYDHSPEGQRHKLARDLRLLHLELAEQPDHPFTLFNLGMTYADQAAYAEAEMYLRRSIDRAGPLESHVRKAYALLVYCLARRGRLAEARAACARGLALYPDDVELRFRHGLLLHDAGELEAAARVYEALLEPCPERHFTSVDRGITGFKARQNLAVVYAELGRPGAAEDQWRRIIAEVPNYRAGWRGLGDVLLAAGDYPSVRALADRLRDEGPFPGEGYFLQGRMAAARGDHTRAATLLGEAVGRDPGEPDYRAALCRVLFEHGAPAEARQALADLVARFPDDAAAHHNLGLVCLRLGETAAAVAALRQSITLRPDAGDTHYHLGLALAHGGDAAAAAAAWQRTLELQPAHILARAALDPTPAAELTTGVPAV